MGWEKGLSSHVYKGILPKWAVEARRHEVKSEIIGKGLRECTRCDALQCISGGHESLSCLFEHKINFLLEFDDTIR